MSTYRKIEDVPPGYREQAKRLYEKAMHRNTSTVTNRESSVKLAKELSVEIHEDKKFTSLVRISFHSIRRGSPDLDNIQGKAALDGLVKIGVLQDDGPRWIPERPRHTVEYGQEEKTIITIEEIG